MSHPILLHQFSLHHLGPLPGRLRGNQSGICEAAYIIVTRRTSGGGGRYDDLGNVSFSFITKDDGDSIGNFRKFTDPVIKALHKLGATQAEMSGRNDLQLTGRSSRNAMKTEKGGCSPTGPNVMSTWTSLGKRWMFQPTRLPPRESSPFTAGLLIWSRSLSPSTSTLPSRNSGHFGQDHPECRWLEGCSTNTVDDETKKNVEQLNQSVYSNWDWVYGESPKAAIQHRQHFTKGPSTFDHLLEDGRIKALKTYGDFFGQRSISEFEQKLIGVATTRLLPKTP